MEASELHARRGGWGIGTAATYLSSVQGCFDGGVCPTSAFSLASADQWAQALKDAEQRLTYCDPDMRVRNGSIKAAKTPGAIMEFECVITTTRRDRDGDVLETKGAIPDPLMPLLWQHIPIEPIGKLLSITLHTDKKLCGRFAIADLPLGRDAATLIEFGGLRISHGFQPLEFEPLDSEWLESQGVRDTDGWHVTKFDIMETSVVSVPSNIDAVIMAYSKNKLHSPLVKQWGARLYAARPVQGKGFDMKEIDPAADKKVDTQAGVKQKPAPAPCSCHAKHSYVAINLDNVGQLGLDLGKSVKLAPSITPAPLQEVLKEASPGAPLLRMKGKGSVIERISRETIEGVSRIVYDLAG